MISSVDNNNPRCYMHLWYRFFTTISENSCCAGALNTDSSFILLVTRPALKMGLYPFGSDFGRQWPDQVWDGRMQPDEGWERSPPSNTSLHQFCLHCHSKIESSLKTTLVYWILPWGCDLISCWNATLLWCRWTTKFFSFKMQRSLVTSGQFE